MSIKASLYVHMRHLGPGFAAELKRALMMRGYHRAGDDQQVSLIEVLDLHRIESAAASPNGKLLVVAEFLVRMKSYVVVVGAALTGTVVAIFEEGVAVEVNAGIRLIVDLPSPLYTLRGTTWFKAQLPYAAIGGTICTVVTDVYLDAGIYKCFAGPAE